MTNSQTRLMKTKLLTILIAAFTSFFCIAQTEINTIDKSVQNIKNNLSSFKKIEKVNTKEGSRFAFIQNKDLKLITVQAIEPTIEKNVEWYYIDGQLAYCETNWVDMTTKKSVFNEKCYLQDGHLIHWTNTRKGTIDSYSSEFKKMDIDLIEYGLKIKDDVLK